MDLVRAAKLTVRCHKLAIKYSDEHELRDDLCGMCCITSTALFLKLRSEGYPARLILGKTIQVDNKRYLHVWVQIGSKIYDPTYLQFDKDNPVYVGKKTNVHRLFKEVKEIENLEEFYTWEESQRPYKERLEWFTIKLAKVKNAVSKN